MVCIIEREYSDKDIKNTFDYIHIKIAGLRKIQITIRKIDDNSCMVGERILLYCEHTLEGGEKNVETAKSKKINVPFEEIKRMYVKFYGFTIKYEGE